MNQAQGKTDQHVTDIQEENRQLRSSIEQKDAALVAIARQQFDLNFAPSVFVVNNGVPDVVSVQNNGKSSIDVIEVRQAGQVQNQTHMPQSVVEGSSTGLKVSEPMRKFIVAGATNSDLSGDSRTSLECSVLIETKNKKRYTLPFTWTFIVKDGAIVSSFATDQPVMELVSNK